MNVSIRKQQRTKIRNISEKQCKTYCIYAIPIRIQNYIPNVIRHGNQTTEDVELSELGDSMEKQQWVSRWISATGLLRRLPFPVLYVYLSSSFLAKGESSEKG